MKGFCVKCKEMVEMTNSKISEINGSRGIRKVAKGNCPKCNTKICAILKNK
ncbi:MAG: hypothetical protein WD876_00470 [Candidatus Pacearchaeota archaeon]